MAVSRSQSVGGSRVPQMAASAEVSQLPGSAAEGRVDAECVEAVVGSGADVGEVIGTVGSEAARVEVAEGWCGWVGVGLGISLLLGSWPYTVSGTSTQG